MKQHFKKTIALFLCAVLSAAFFTGCHGSQAELATFAVPDEFDTSRTYEISFWAKNDTNKAQTKVYEQAIEDFQELYPNIHVNLRLYTDYEKIYNDVITNIATQTTPNVCITYPDHIATYLTGSNIVVPLNALFEDPEYGLGGSELLFNSPTQDEMVPQFLKECEFNGTYYAIPYMRSTEVCYVNKTYVEKLGYTLPEVLTWDFIWEVSEAAAKKDADGNFLANGQKIMIPFIYKSTDNMMIQMLRQTNSGYSNANGKILLFNDNTKGFLEEIASHAKSGAFSTFKISGYPANFLNAGQCLFAVDSTAGSTWMGSHAPLSDISPDKYVDFETEVFPIPQFDPKHPQMISQGPSVCVFNKADSQEVLASWLFAQFLLTNKVQIGYAETEGYIPVTQKAHQDPSYQDYLAHQGDDNETYYDVKLKASQLLLNHTQDTFTTPVFSGSTSLRSAAGQLIENTVKSIKRKETVDNAYYDKLFDDVSALYRLDQIDSQNHSLSGKTDLGPLPLASVILLGTLGFIWILIILYIFINVYKKRAVKQHNRD